MQDEIQTSLDEIFRLWLQMKSNPPNITLRSKISSQSDFIHVSGFIPSAKTDLVEKDLRFVSNLKSFSGRSEGIRTPDILTSCLLRCPKFLLLVAHSQKFWPLRLWALPVSSTGRGRVHSPKQASAYLCSGCWGVELLHCKDKDCNAKKHYSLYGRSEEARTPDILLPNALFYVPDSPKPR